MARSPFDDFEPPDDPGPTAQPRERPPIDEDDEKVVPISNVGGASPTSAGLDSGGNFAGPEDDLANLSEPEPPEAPELDAVHARDEEEL
jgi:hypothetical protein